MSEIADKEHLEASKNLKDLMAVYNDAKDLIDIGAYKKGSDKKIDTAIESIDEINKFLKQDTYEKVEYKTLVDRMLEISRKAEKYEP